MKRNRGGFFLSFSMRNRDQQRSRIRCLRPTRALTSFSLLICLLHMCSMFLCAFPGTARIKFSFRVLSVIWKYCSGRYTFTSITTYARTCKAYKTEKDALATVHSRINHSAVLSYFHPILLSSEARWKISRRRISYACRNEADMFKLLRNCRCQVYRDLYLFQVNAIETRF